MKNNLLINRQNKKPITGYICCYFDNEKTIPALKGYVKKGKLEGSVMEHDYVSKRTEEHIYKKGKKLYTREISTQL